MTTRTASQSQHRSALILDEAAAPWGKATRTSLSFMILVALMLPWVLARISIGNFMLHLVILFFIWSVVVQSWNLIMGVAGIYSLAQVALFAVGGWVTGTLALHYGWNPWLSILLAPVAATAAALLIGLPTLRLRGVYVVLLTLAFHELLRNYITNGPREISGGGYGLINVPKLQFGDIGVGNDLISFYYVALVLFIVATYAMWRIFHSPIGMAFTALRDSETYAVSRGINQFRIRLFLFGFSAFFTGLAGGLMTHYLGSISTSIFSFAVLTNLLAMIIIGGLGSFGGPIAGTALLIVLSEWLRGLADYRTLALGLVMAAVAVLTPQGLFPPVSNRIRRFVVGGEEERSKATIEGAE